MRSSSRLPALNRRHPVTGRPGALLGMLANLSARSGHCWTFLDTLCGSENAIVRAGGRTTFTCNRRSGGAARIRRPVAIRLNKIDPNQTISLHMQAHGPDITKATSLGEGPHHHTSAAGRAPEEHQRWVQSSPWNPERVYVPSQGPTCRRSSGACRDLFRAFLQNKPKPGPSIGTARPS